MSDGCRRSRRTAARNVRSPRRFEAVAPPHDWWDWYAAYMDAREHGSSPVTPPRPPTATWRRSSSRRLAAMTPPGASVRRRPGLGALVPAVDALRVDRRSPGYCRVTFDHPPINTITATTVEEQAELVGLIEQDADLKTSCSPATCRCLAREHVARPVRGRRAWSPVAVRLRAPEGGPQTWLVGLGSSSDVVLGDPLVSREHVFRQAHVRGAGALSGSRRQSPGEAAATAAQKSRSRRAGPSSRAGSAGRRPCRAPGPRARRCPCRRPSPSDRGAIHGSAASTSTPVARPHDPPAPTNGSACAALRVGERVGRHQRERRRREHGRAAVGHRAVEAQDVAARSTPARSSAPRTRGGRANYAVRRVEHLEPVRPRRVGGGQPVDVARPEARSTVMPSGPVMRSATSSDSGLPAARASSTPSRSMPRVVAATPRRAGRRAAGSATRATNSSPDIAGGSGPGKTPRSSIAACSGVCSSTAPQPGGHRQQVADGDRAAAPATVRSSGASGATRTRGLAASGSQRAIGSSSASTPSCTRQSASAPPIGLVTEAMRKQRVLAHRRAVGVERHVPAGAHLGLTADAHRGHVAGDPPGRHAARRAPARCRRSSSFPPPEYGWTVRTEVPSATHRLAAAPRRALRWYGEGALIRDP